MNCVKLFILLFAFSYAASAQVTQPARFEKDKKANDHDFIIISLEKEGLALFRESEKYKEGMHRWELTILDSTLHVKIDTAVSIDKDYTFTGHEYTKGKLNLLFKDEDFTRNKMIMCTIDLYRYEIELFDIKTELDFKLTHFNRIGNNILFGGYISEEPAVLFFDVSESKLRVVPGFLQSNTELLDLRINENNTFNIVLLEKVSSEARRIIFRTFDSQAKLLLEDIIVTENTRAIQTGISSRLEREDLLLIGTWGSRNSTKASGFYTTLINPFEEQATNFTAFGSLTHYLDYLNPRRAEKIKTKTKSALAAGKIYEFTSNVIPYRIVETTEGYFLLAETYSPINANNPNYYNSPNNGQNWNNPYYYNNPFYNPYPTSRIYRPSTYSNTVTNETEIKTYSSSLLFINKKGEIEKDYSLKIENRKLQSINQVSDVSTHQGKLFLLYREKENIIYKKIEIETDLEESGQEILKLNDSFDELRHEDENYYGILHWYGNSFYTWGSQTIRNQQTTNAKTREVFYINKIHIQ